MSSFTRLLADAFPSIATDPKDAACVLSRHYYDDRPEMALISTAIDVAITQDQRGTLIDKLKREHPGDREHLEQYDERVFDVLTEACALAWATGHPQLGTPLFSTAEGTPDIRCKADWWIEAKAIGSSEENKQRIRWLLDTGGVDTGVVAHPTSGLLDKFVSAFEDAQRKVERQNGGRLIVFFNLTSLDLPQLPIEQEVLRQVIAKVAALGAKQPDTETVLCYRYNWPNPLGGTIEGNTMT